MNRRGSVIILVLVTILLAGFLLAGFLQRAGTELLADARAAQRGRLQREAYSALEVTLAVLADARTWEGAASSTAPSWDRPLEYAGYQPRGVEIQVSFEDETTRISLPRSDQATLEKLFVSLGADGMQAGRASEALLAWMQPGNDTQTHDYENENPPHRAAQRPLRSYEELASVAVVRDILFDRDGRPNDKFRKFITAVSLHSFNQTKPVDIPTTKQRNQLPTEPDILRINVTTAAGSLVYRMTAVVATGAGPALRLLEIQEDLPSPASVPNPHA